MDWQAIKREYERGNIEVVKRLLEAVIYESQFKQRTLNQFGGG